MPQHKGGELEVGVKRGPIVSIRGGCNDLVARWLVRLAAMKGMEQVHGERQRASQVGTMWADTGGKGKSFF